ncbi:isoprenoid synthase domain-containing protein [Nemania sp. FL0031]|nr:isoprenoid synthase domain-containing protein [Nemania sp. FL0031]
MPGTTDAIQRKIAPLLVNFEKSMGYTKAIGTDRAIVHEAMHLQASQIAVPYPEGSASWHAFHTAVNYACFCYPNLPLEYRVWPGIYTWLAIILDDDACKSPEEWYQFGPRFLAGAKQHNCVAQEFDRWLRLTYDYYSPIVANFIITASLNFVNATALEGSEVPKMARTAGGENWAYFLRDKNGLGEFYAWTTFPKTVCPEISWYMEAIPDMARYFCFANDIFSFYKEECAQETDNYMHLRAAYEGIDASEMLKQVIEEVVSGQRRISLVLKGKEPYAQLWNDHVLGFIAFHKTSERYRLRDLGLNESLP